MAQKRGRASCDATALLKLDAGAGFFKLLLDVFCFVLGNGFLDGRRYAFDGVLGFLETERGHLANRLDDIDLLVAEGREQIANTAYDDRFSTQSRRIDNAPGNDGAREPLYKAKLVDRKEIAVLAPVGRIEFFVVVVLRAVKAAAGKAPVLVASGVDLANIVDLAGAADAPSDDTEENRSDGPRR